MNWTGNKGDRAAFSSSSIAFPFSFFFLKRKEYLLCYSHKAEVINYDKQQDPLNLHIGVRFSPMINKPIH